VVIGIKTSTGGYISAPKKRIASMYTLSSQTDGGSPNDAV